MSDHTAENDTQYRCIHCTRTLSEHGPTSRICPGYDGGLYEGHGPDCTWDEVRARMWCGKEHDERYARVKAARKAQRKAARRARWGF